MKKAFSFIPSIFKIDGCVILTDEKPSDRKSLELIHEYVTIWCISNQFLLPSQNGGYVPNIDPSQINNRLREYIYTLNFKRLCIDSYLQELLIRLNDTEYDKTTTRLIDLHIQILTDIDTRFINLYINKLIYVLSTIYPDDVIDHEWEMLFKQFPYLWIIYIIQHIMRHAMPMSL